ncbi:type I-F CRISPR-associated helicase Cas3f [Maridesulfovibrio hydrothermalis]|uniref:HD Cas3-type domain-containing protein n=1 Tax=Maridesulfovibrio hydrothermalis AM13 = DSM 14728 TaxID=1121451 RepID=L0RFX5_9BACT|nr:type I-F CRISPR-associated helicase Cas3f [Maridesulfovibrio hydrothermalis]CCO24446.1 conserved protein of unknown function [Maridesulfovibrio hydrothermalis AM13 = DSM 14728]
MNVLLISKCSKNGAKETRRIIDQFAMRIGTDSWQTSITQRGLDTLRKMLRKTARKNTAVACHWIRKKNHSELMWIVGNQSAFNDQGAVPTNYSYNNILRAGDENDWNSLESIRLLTVVAALFHDAGKASIHFQNKLKNSAFIADPYRHEWVSLRIFQNFVKKRTDAEWIASLANGDFSNLWRFSDSFVMDGLSEKPCNPFTKIDNMAALVSWLIVSHHRIPVPTTDTLTQAQLQRLPKRISANWIGTALGVDDKALKNNWSFNSSPFTCAMWEKQMKRAASKILARQDMFTQPWLDNSFAVHISRLALVMADHYYSSLTDSKDRIAVLDEGLFANTKRGPNNKSMLNQGLSEHLIGVAGKSSLFLHQLPNLRKHLPRISRHKGFIRRTSIKQFQWQNKCYDLAKSIGPRSADHGFFGINMGSTGCGKTFANGRIMYGLGNCAQGVRFTYALGLRTLTLQTGQAYREMLSLSDEELAVLVGGGAVRKIYEHQQNNQQVNPENIKNPHTKTNFLLDDNSHVLYEGTTDTTALAGWFDNNLRSKKLISAPITICTIDHLMPATESLKGGHQIPPMLRLLTSDLILDEPDDFSLADLHGLTRLVNWAGMLGSRVLLSSATMPPSFVEGLYESYLAGQKNFRKNCGTVAEEAPICCAWFDEFSSVSKDVASAEDFANAHSKFVDNRCKKISATNQRKRGVIVPVLDSEKNESPYRKIATSVLKYSKELHDNHHCINPDSSKKVSFGLVRMANITPLVETVKELSNMEAPTDTQIHICCYHSQYPLLVRSAIEGRLDCVLKRTSEHSVFENETVCIALDNSPAKNHIFIILATAVAEVGRDHDYDWAVIEPSSMRSIIQLAGRVWRHRKDKQCTEPNIYILEKNIKELKNENVVFTKPGFEEKEHKLTSHNLNDVLTEDQYLEINSLPRIKERDELKPKNNLVDLEHFQIRNTMVSRELAYDDESDGADRWWTSRANLSGYLQKTKRFRAGEKNSRYCCALEDEYSEPRFTGFNDNGEEIDCNYLFRDEGLDLEHGKSIQFWQGLEFKDAAVALAESLDMEIEECTKIFGQFALRESGEETGWLYHPRLGFYAE